MQDDVNFQDESLMQDDVIFHNSVCAAIVFTNKDLQLGFQPCNRSLLSLDTLNWSDWLDLIVGDLTIVLSISLL